MGKQVKTTMTKRLASQVTGGLSRPDKMPGPAYSIPAKLCQTGSRLRKVKGSTCEVCYALKGRNVFPTVQAAQMRRYERVMEALNNKAFRPVFVSAFVHLLNGTEWFRWHDAGDLISTEHLGLICEIARLSPETHHWLPTREYKIVSDYLAAGGEIPDNLVIRLSAHMVDGPLPEKLAAKHPGLTVSGVSTIAGDCNAQKRKDGTCGTCRTCWNRNVPSVTYLKH